MKTKKLLSLYIALLFIVVLGMCLLLFSQKKNRDYSQIQKEGVLRMITEYNQTGYYISGDTIEGFQYELAQAISQLTGLEVEIHLESNLTKSFKALSDHNCDIIARNIPVTTELKDMYLFTDPVLFNKQVLVQRTAESNHNLPPVRNHLELAKKTLYIPQNSPALLRLRNLGQEIGDTIYVIEEPLSSSEQLIAMVANGDIAYAVCDQQIALQSKKQMQEIDILTDISFTQLQSWAIRKDAPVLHDSLNSWFRQIKENGLYNKIYTRYYKE
jgi:membrane-bound lytic murein transglycosylase MltF